MNTSQVADMLRVVLDELANGTSGRARGGPFVLNSGDVGLMRSLDRLSDSDASRSTNAGATIAAHAQHVRFGLSLMNKWSREGGDPFSSAKWDEAWEISAVDAAKWKEIRDGLREELRRWSEVLGAPREVSDAELGGMIGSIAHLGYHLGAIRQISRVSRGPREGTFP